MARTLLSIVVLQFCQIKQKSKRVKFYKTVFIVHLVQCLQCNITMPIYRTPIVPNQLWKEDEKIWNSTPKNEVGELNKELLAVSNVRPQVPEKSNDKIENLPSPSKSSDELREVLDNFVKIACLPEIYQSEYDFINLIDEFISSLILHSDMNECSYLKEQLDGLCAKYNTLDESLVLRYIIIGIWMKILNLLSRKPNGRIL